MALWFRQLDDLLRGRKTAPDQLAEGRIEVRLRMFVPLAVVLGATYGFFMGWYAIFSRDPASYIQLVASTVKLPALFLLTLVVTFPSLYVFNALVDCRLDFAATLRLLVGAVVVNVTVAASLGPILGFFTVSTTSYPFMVLLNVVLLAVAGMVALGFLLHTLRRLAVPPPGSLPPTSPPPVPPENTSSGGAPNSGTPNGGAMKEDTSNGGMTNGAESTGAKRPDREPGPLDYLSADVPNQALGQARTVFRIWVVIYGLVGAQMGWLLRPFIGSPNLKFEWFRHREGNFFQAVFDGVQRLLGG